MICGGRAVLSSRLPLGSSKTADAQAPDGLEIQDAKALRPGEAVIRSPVPTPTRHEPRAPPPGDRRAARAGFADAFQARGTT